MPFRIPGMVGVGVYATGLLNIKFIFNIRFPLSWHLTDRKYSEILTDMDIALRKLVVAVTMVLVLGSKLATVDSGCHDMDDSVVDQT